MLITDVILILPANVPIKLIAIADEMPYTLSLPKFSVEIDVVPGRVSEQIIIIDRPGVF
jgi:heme/copper-type cytochrome/quinol oxidase subunit 2